MNGKPALSDRPVAIVTGAARGIGRECARALAGIGFNLVLNDHDGESERAHFGALTDELSALGADSFCFPADIRDYDGYGFLLDSIIERWGRIDCLVNNAGVSVRKRGDLLDVQPDSFDFCIEVNTKAVFFLSQAVARRMIRQGEIGAQHRSIITITSSNAAAVSVTRAEYCISKAAASMVSRLFALRLADEGIGVYEIRPGIIDTKMTATVKNRYDALIEDGTVPMRRWGLPKDIASSVTSMAEGRLPYTVGQVIDVDGGLSYVTF